MTTEIPHTYKCPILGQIFMDPVFTADGHTYERQSIERWFLTNNTSPNTGLKLANKNLTANISMKQLVETFLETHPDLKAEQFAATPFSKAEYRILCVNPDTKYTPEQKAQRDAVALDYIKKCDLSVKNDDDHQWSHPIHTIALYSSVSVLKKVHAIYASRNIAFAAQLDSIGRDYKYYLAHNKHVRAALTTKQRALTDIEKRTFVLAPNKLTVQATFNVTL